MGAAILANGESAAVLPYGVSALAEGMSVIDAVEAGIRKVELDPTIDSVGLGGLPNMLGEVECDAAIMCGSTLRTGAVAALKRYFHAISVARQVMERTPYVMLAGEGACRFASEIGAAKGELLTQETRSFHEQWLKEHLDSKSLAAWPDIPLLPLIPHATDALGARGTAVALVRAADGRMAAGASSSGLIFKYPGRVGDSAVVGAGIYVDDRYGGAACTHIGEMTIRAGTCRAIVAYMKKGATVGEACHEAFEELRSLEGGYTGRAVIHAMDRNGSPYVISTHREPYWYWTEDVNQIELGTPVIEPL